MNLGKEVKTCIDILKSGGIILYPADTMWGLGCDATNQEAIKKINRLKQRDELQPLINLVENDNQINKHVKNLPDVAWDLFDSAEDPLTLILDIGMNLPQGAIAENGNIAIRRIKNEFCEMLIRKLNRPLTSTSANIHGKPAPKRFEDINPIILDGVDYVVNLQPVWGQNLKPSTIIRLGNGGEIKIIRN